LSGVSIAHVGHFDPEYSRNRIMAKALVRAGARVVTITDPRSYVQRTPKLAAGLLRAQWDAILVAFPGHADVALARAVSLRHGVPVVFDAFVSMLETAEDRGIDRGYRAIRSRLEDRLACRLATTVLLDTAAHMEHFRSTFGVPIDKMRRVWVGADDEVVRPTPLPDDDRFRVFLYASFVPLHGVE